MTPEELRDRVQDTLSEHRTVANGPGDCACACNRTWVSDVEYRRHLAQAVIDDLALTVETRAVAPSYDGGHVYYNPEAARNPDAMGAHIASLPVESRVAGKWMKEEA